MFNALGSNRHRGILAKPGCGGPLASMPSCTTYPSSRRALMNDDLGPSAVSSSWVSRRNYRRNGHFRESPVRVEADVGGPVATGDPVYPTRPGATRDQGRYRGSMPSGSPFAEFITRFLASHYDARNPSSGDGTRACRATARLPTLPTHTPARRRIPMT